MYGRGIRGARTALLMVLCFFACEMETRAVLGTEQANGPPSYPVSETCRTGDPNRLCLALKYVSYQDASGKTVTSQASALENVREINRVWSQCNLGFQIEQYLSVDPRPYSLRFNTANLSELDDIRMRFGDERTLLVVTTGRWNRGGTLGSSGANAWTSLPGSGPYGAILEQPVALYWPILGHELGHYLNLTHVPDIADLMTPTIYTTSTKLDPSQCAIVRAATVSYWTSALR